MVGNIDQYTPSTQTEIRFKPGQSVLSKAAKDDTGRNGHPAEEPARLHRRSARLLVWQGSDCDPELAEDGRVRGPLPACSTMTSRSTASTSSAWATLRSQATATTDTKTKRTNGGRVEISLLKNNLDQLASGSTTAVPLRRTSSKPPRNNSTQAGLRPLPQEPLATARGFSFVGVIHVGPAALGWAAGHSSAMFLSARPLYLDAA